MAVDTGDALDETGWTDKEQKLLFDQMGAQMLASPYSLPLHTAPKAFNDLMRLSLSKTSPRLRTSKSVYQTSVGASIGKHLNIVECKSSVSGAAPGRTRRMSSDAVLLPTNISSFGGQVAMPDVLSFESWWNEGQTRVSTLIHFDTATRVCTASIKGVVGVNITLPDGSALEATDLHVGAQISVLGRRVTLRRTANYPTLEWLDSEARALLAEKQRLEHELSKFRHVTKHCGQYNVPQRSEMVVMALHAHTPNGGRVNLRTLQTNVEELMLALRQHRLLVSSPLFLTSVREPDGPTDWSPERVSLDVLAERTASERKSLLRSDAGPRAGPRDHLEWLKTIPLAATAAALVRNGNKFVDSASGNASGTISPSASMASHLAGPRRASGLSLNVGLLQKPGAAGAKSNISTSSSAVASSAGPASTSTPLPPLSESKE